MPRTKPKAAAETQESRGDDDIVMLCIRTTRARRRELIRASADLDTHMTALVMGAVEVYLERNYRNTRMARGRI